MIASLALGNTNRSQKFPKIMGTARWLRQMFRLQQQLLRTQRMFEGLGRILFFKALQLIFYIKTCGTMEFTTRVALMEPVPWFSLQSGSVSMFLASTFPIFRHSH